MREHISFPSIEQFRHVKSTVEFKSKCVGFNNEEKPIFDESLKLPSIEFVGTIKLHGTNAGIVLKQDECYAQSRERIITPENDNAGFAKFVANLPAVLLDQFRTYCGGDAVIYGEWIGKGVQASVGVSQLNKRFVIFAAKHIESDKWIDCSGLKCNAESIYNIFDYKTYNIVIDFENPQPALDTINKWTLEVEENCPVASAMGVNGIGEGIVWAPIDPKWRENLPKMVFKTKGLKHSASVKKEATIDPIKSSTVDAFATRHVVEDRLNQAWQHLIDSKYELTEKSTGHFIKWIVSDIAKEANDELTASNLTMKDVNSTISAIARKWYFAKINQ